MKIFGVLLAVISSVFFARIMGVNEYGLYTFVLELAIFISFPLTIGLPTLITREVALYNASSEYSLISGIIQWSNKFVFRITIIVCFIVTILVFCLDIEFKKTILYAIPIVIFGGFSQLRIACLRGYKEVVKSEFPETILRPLLLIIINAIIFYFLKIEISSITGIITYSVAIFFAFLLSSIWLKKSRSDKGHFTDPQFNKEYWKKEAVPFFMLGSIALVNTKLSMILLGFFRHSSDVGIYKIAVTASTIISFLLISVNMTLSPIISELYSLKKLDQLQKILSKTVRITFICSLVFFAFYTICGKFFINLFYGKDFIKAYEPLLILSFGQLVNSAAGSVANVLNMTGNQSLTVKGQLASAIISILFSLILIPYFGLIGSALATSLSLVIWNIILLYFLKKKVGIKTSLL